MSLETVESVDQSAKVGAVVDLDTDFANHLTVEDSLLYILKEGVTVDVLVNPKVKGIYRFAQHYHETNGKAPTSKVLQTEFPHFSFEQPESEVRWLVTKLRERYQKNEIEQVVEELAKLQATPDQAMPYLRQRVVEIDHATFSHGSVVTKGDHVFFLKELQNDIMEGMYQGSSYGFLEIDKFTGGRKPGEVGYILARPKRQKSFMWLQAFLEDIKLGKNPYLETLELTRKEIQARLSCMISGFSWDKMQKGELMPADYKMISDAWEQFDETWGDYWIEMPPQDERTVADLVRRADQVGAGSIYISQFAYIESAKDYRNEFDKFKSIAIDLKRAATKQGSERPIYVEAQYNRGGDTMEELEDFNGSKVGLTDMIVQSADILMGIFQSKDLRDSQQIEMGILESRNTDKAAWYIHSEYRSHTEIKLVNGSRH